MEKILPDLPCVLVYIDDLLITGQDEHKHLQVLEQVLQRLEEFGLKLKLEKCWFMQPSIDYLGYCIDNEGLHAMPEKVAAILEAPPPKTVHELQAFLGRVNYYGKFVKNFATLLHPLNQLLCQGATKEWNWECKMAFDELKSKMASTEVLAHYNTAVPLKLDCDASAYGVGAMLSHLYEDGSERPIAYASRKLSSD